MIAGVYAPWTARNSLQSNTMNHIRSQAVPAVLRR